MSDPAAIALSPDDEAALHAVMARHAAAWNAHDMAALVADMAADVGWINVVGMQWTGREQVRRAHEALHRTMFATSRLTQMSLELRAVADGLALGINRTMMEGAGPTPDGRPYPAAGSVMTLLFARTDGAWRIVHGHNTNIDARAAAHDPATAAGPR
ncbi:SgcJ/EcaC family oxidoreductase [Sphingomonas bacterium]|uniref:SgcJ/EcaC family oxidoreductase n=1 Tax=Sphingomonas bacterium TaxID=1895847 RepID=UPI00157555B5|nr:SgcJ/EcaC family oxidoreductase [Sphingomonas bacterium]